jgi:putative secretion ATPase (PEP-CTERM system associated)
MYVELFGLSEMPFRLTPDPHFLFASKQHARAKAYMESTIWLADGFVVITGEIGSGKTTLIESFLAELPENVVLAQINQTQLSPVEFLQALLVEFGFKPFRQKKIELLATLREFMIEQYAAGKTLLLVVDEAQNLSRRVLEEIRMLSGIESKKDKLLRIILAGQPELARKLESPHLEQLSQRVRLKFHLSALSKRETREYIEHRLEIAGAAGRRIFGDDAFDLIFRYTGGIPRLTNVLCDTAMLCAFAEEKSTVAADGVRAAVAELQWVPFAERRPAVDRSGAAAGGFAHPVSHLARFDVLFRDQVVADFPVALGRTIIGRTADNDLQIRSKFVSRHHAQIITTAQGCVIEDLNSTNGIFVRSRRVKHHELVEGDVVQLGEHKLLYHDLRGQHASTAEFEELEDVEDLDEDEDDAPADEVDDEADEPAVSTRSKKKPV